MSDTLGFIGLGRMGAPMLRRLLAAGHHVAVHDLSQDAVAPFTGEAAVSICASPRAVAERASVVLLSLPTPEALHAVALGPDGIAGAGNRVPQAGSRPTVIDLSTSGVAAAVAVAEALAACGIGYLDAPVSGGVAGAERGTLSVMVAGDTALYEAYHDLLSTIGGNVFYVGPRPGQGQAMKLVNNILSATALAATAEAMAVATKAGIAPRTALAILNVSSGRNSATEDKFPRAVITGSFDAGFLTRLMLKDVQLFETLADELAVPTPLARAVVSAWQLAVAHGYADADFTSIARMVEGWSGIEIRDEGSR